MGNREICGNILTAYGVSDKERPLAYKSFLPVPKTHIILNQNKQESSFHTRDDHSASLVELKLVELKYI